MVHPAALQAQQVIACLHLETGKDRVTGLLTDCVVRKDCEHGRGIGILPCFG